MHNGGDDRVVAEHALHARERAVGAVVRGLVTSPETELAAVGRHDLVGYERELGDPRGRRAGRDPAFELPTHALGERTRGKDAALT